MSPSTAGRAKRLLGELAAPDSRRSALGKIRRKVARIAGRPEPSRPAAGAAVRPPKRGAGPTALAPVTQPTPKPPRWYQAEWSRLARAVLGPSVAAKGVEVDPERAQEAQKAAARARAQAVLADALATGMDLELAVPRCVASLIEIEEWNPAWALAEAVGRLPGGETASALGHIVHRHRRRNLPRAWALVAGTDDAVLRRCIPVEAVDVALGSGAPDGRAKALRVGTPTPAMDPAVLVDLAGRFVAFGERDAAAALLAELDRRAAQDLDDGRRHARRVIERAVRPHPVAVPDGAVPVGIIGYGSPDPVLTSGNIGDYVQTLALAGNLARLADVAWSGEDGLGELIGELRDRVPADLRATGIAGRGHLFAVDRDFSSAADIPAGTWMLAFGWHMHPLFDLRTDFPYHPAIRPLFVSFHVNRLDMLDAAGLEYLRAHGPVGCRDWTTVFLLLSAGVDAFFTGCLTTTVDALFPPREAAFKGGQAVGVIDLPAKAAGAGARDVRLYSHQSDATKEMPVADGIRAADAALRAYQRDLSRAVTGRLHAYLPLTSLGVPVEFRPGSPGDVRFAGLAGFQPGDQGILAMRTGLRALIAETMADVLGGVAEDEVYARWRARTADAVAEAKRRFAAPVEDHATTIDIEAAVAAARAGSRRFGPHDTVDPATVTDLVLCYDQNLLHPAAVLLESVLANASGPVRLWLLGRGLDDGYLEWLAGAFPALPITYLPCDQVTYGPKGRPARIPVRITISTMDRLLLPAMLGDIDRVVYLDVDTVMLGDLTALAATDLEGHAVAARDSFVSEASEWRRAGRRLSEADALELRRGFAMLHGFGVPALNAGVLVMDLDRMRRDDFARRLLGLVERYGLNDQDSMLAYAGPARKVLDAGWNTLPVFEDIAEPDLIHWASLGKPWEPHLTWGKDRWLPYADSLRARAGMPPVSTEGGDAGPAGSLHNPTAVGPRTTPIGPRAERTIQAVREEHLTYLDVPSLRTLGASVEAVEADGIEGLVIECGTARGGSAIVLASAKAPGRPMRVYDVFGMIPPPGEKDGEDVHRRYATIVSGMSKGIDGETYYGYRTDLLAEVTESFARHGLELGANAITLVQGPFEETLRVDEPVALAHLDGDWYSSTMACLSAIAPRLAVGGRIIVDDYDTWSGCRTAVHEYFEGRAGYRFERRGRLHVVRT